MRRFSKRSALALCILYVIAYVVVVRLTIDASLFADFNTYVTVARGDALSKSEWSVIDPFSQAMFATFRALSATDENAVRMAHGYVSAVFVVGILLLLKKVQVSWQGFLLFVSLFGALLAFVTIRATPAYLLVTFSVLTLPSWPVTALVLGVIGVAFHVSAGLAFLVLLFSVVVVRVTELRQWFSSVKLLIVLAAIAAAAVAVFPGSIIKILSWLLSLIGAGFEKYQVYASSASQPRTLFHWVYYLCVVGLAVLTLRWRKWLSKDQATYFAYSIIIFFALSVFPVVAFRQSIFWVAPLVLLLPWDRVIRTPLHSILWVGLCVSLAMFSFFSVLAV